MKTFISPFSRTIWEEKIQIAKLRYGSLTLGKRKNSYYTQEKTNSTFLRSRLEKFIKMMNKESKSFWTMSTMHLQQSYLSISQLTKMEKLNLEDMLMKMNS